MKVTKRPSTEDGVIDQELSLREYTVEMVVTFEEVKMKEEEEDIKAVVDLEKEDLEEMEIIKTEVKVGLEEAKVKEGLMGLEQDEAKEVAVGMEMVKNLRRT